MRRKVLTAAAESYRSAMTQFSNSRDLDVWYAFVDAKRLSKRVGKHLDAARRKQLGKILDRAQTRDNKQALRKLTTVDDRGLLRIRADPPLVVPLRDLVSEVSDAGLDREVLALLDAYGASLAPERRALLERYAFVDMARKVVGVGSVGTRCWIVLLTGRDDDDPLFLQTKEATSSVLADVVGDSQFSNQGQRVVVGQRLMQQASDIFLGWQDATGIDGAQRDFYVRQLRDWKGSITADDLRPEGLLIYARVCAWSLARAHARTGDRHAIAGYLGSSPEFDHALAEFAEAYADLNEADHQSLAADVASGQVDAVTGL